MTAVSKLSSKGQVTIPIEIRRHLGAEEGDQMVFQVLESGRVVMEVSKRKSLRNLLGIIKVDRTFDLDEARKEMRDSISDQFIQERNGG